MASYVILITYQRQWLQIIWEYVGKYLKWAWNHILELKKFYFVKVFIGVLSSYITAASGYWLYNHFDLLHIIEATKDFIVAIPQYLADSRLLIEAIHKWLNKIFLGYVVEVMTTIWDHTMKTIVERPLMGLLYVGISLALLVIVLVLAQCLPQLIKLIKDLYVNLQPYESRRLYNVNQDHGNQDNWALNDTIKNKLRTKK